MKLIIFKIINHIDLQIIIKIPVISRIVGGFISELSFLDARHQDQKLGSKIELSHFEWQDSNIKVER